MFLVQMLHIYVNILCYKIIITNELEIECVLQLIITQKQNKTPHSVQSTVKPDVLRVKSEINFMIHHNITVLHIYKYITLCMLSQFMLYRGKCFEKEYLYAYAWYVCFNHQNILYVFCFKSLNFYKLKLQLLFITFIY